LEKDGFVFITQNTEIIAKSQTMHRLAYAVETHEWLSVGADITAIYFIHL